MNHRRVDRMRSIIDDSYNDTYLYDDLKQFFGEEFAGVEYEEGYKDGYRDSQQAKHGV